MGTTPDNDRIVSPLVLHDLPESERCIDTRMRSHRIQDLWQLCAAERDARGRTLPAARQLMLQRHCRTEVPVEFRLPAGRSYAAMDG